MQMPLISFGKKEIKALSAQVNNLQRQLIPFQRSNTMNLLNNSIAYYPDYKVFANADRYCTTDDLYSIVKLLSTTEALIPLWGYEVKADKPLKQLKSLTHKSPPRLHKALELKALEDLPDTDPLAVLLENPNDYQGKFEFYEGLYTFLNTQGEAFIYKQRPEFGINAGRTVQMHLLFPQFVIMNIASDYPYGVTGYKYVVDGRVLIDNIPIEDIIHIKYFNPNFSVTGTELRGLSPFKVLAKRLSRMDSEMDVSVAQLQNGGVPVIVWDKNGGDTVNDDNGRETTVNALRKDGWYRFQGNKNNAGSPFFASGEMGAIQTGLKLADLEVADLAKIDFKKVCNVYSVSDRLFNNDATGSEVSDDNARKGLYTNACLPNVFRVRDALIKGLLPDFTDKKRWINADISEIQELQENSKDMATWLATSYWITPNEKREMMKFDRLEDPVFDQPIIPMGLQTLEDLIAVPDLPLDTQM